MRATQTKIVERLSRSRELVVLDEIQPESENRPVGILRTFTFKLLPTFAVVYAGLCRGNSYGFHVNHRRPLCPEWISISQDLTFWRINDRFPATLYISFTFTDMTSDKWKVSPALRNRQIVMKFSEIYRFPWNRCFQESVWLIVDAPQAITIESFLGFQLLPCCQLFPLVARQECLSSCTTWPPITF